MDVGRNNPCGCGSGKKYKKCCGKVRVVEDEEHIVASLDFKEIVPPDLLSELQKSMTNAEIVKLVEDGIKKGLQSYTTGKVSVVKVPGQQEN